MKGYLVTGKEGKHVVVYKSSQPIAPVHQLRSLGKFKEIKA
jgi:hypothetical protein